MENGVFCSFVGNVGYDVVRPNAKIWKVALCEGRHPIPDAVDGAIFDSELNPLDIPGMEAAATQWIHKRIPGQWVRHEFADVFEVDGIIHLYVTGLTVALVAVINAATLCGVPLVLWHYNRDGGDYYSQPVPSTWMSNAEPITD